MLICDKDFQDVTTYVDFFKENNKIYKPLAKLFKTDSCYYIYDTGTSKVMSCGELEYHILDKIIKDKIDEISELSDRYTEEKFFSALDNIKSAIEEESILKAGKTGVFYSPGHFENLNGMLDNALRQITLELTEKCNLRCGYCIYNDCYEQKRDHGTSDMTEEIAKAAIDYAGLHGDVNDGVAITFYGGEPLLKFDLIKYSIEYAKETIKDKKVWFSMTTNLTLMTPEIAEYLASVGTCSVLCSIDGPEDVHDSYRKDLTGEGSFNKVINGLKCLVEAFGEKAVGMISLSMVFAPPFSYEKLQKIEEFFNSLEWLPKEIGKLITYPTLGSVPDEVVEMLKDNDESRNKDKINDILANWSKAMYFSKLHEDTPIEFFAKRAVESPFLTIHKRPIYSLANSKYPLNACCIPGSRRLYITSKGDFLVCERIDGSPVIGNVFTGIDKENIKKVLVDQYSSESVEECSNCWAARLCNVCYAHCYTDGKLDMEKKRSYCYLTQHFMLNNLTFYHKCLEANPTKLEYLNEIQTS